MCTFLQRGAEALFTQSIDPGGSECKTGQPCCCICAGHTGAAPSSQVQPTLRE